MIVLPSTPMSVWTSAASPPPPPPPLLSGALVLQPVAVTTTAAATTTALREPLPSFMWCSLVLDDRTEWGLSGVSVEEVGR